MMLNILWEFTVKEGSEAEFEKGYAAQGAWAQFFRACPQYRGTTLLRDSAHPRRYVTIDVWDDIESYEAFRAESVKEYNALDVQFEALTESEKRIGVFAVADADSAKA